jgi:hypothetical protein
MNWEHHILFCNFFGLILLNSIPSVFLHFAAPSPEFREALAHFFRDKQLVLFDGCGGRMGLIG